MNNNISFDCARLLSPGNGYTELIRRMHLLGEAIGFGIIRVDMVSLSWEGGTERCPLAERHFRPTRGDTHHSIDVGIDPDYSIIKCCFHVRFSNDTLSLSIGSVEVTLSATGR